jgi:hypothetical protein
MTVAEELIPTRLSVFLFPALGAGYPRNPEEPTYRRWPGVRWQASATVDGNTVLRTADFTLKCIRPYLARC